MAMTFPPPAAVAFAGSAHGQDGLVAAWTAEGGVGTLSLYRLTAAAGQLSPVAAVSVADAAAASCPTEVYFGDVDPAHDGDEIVVAQFDHPSGRLRLHVFAGSSEGRLHRVSRRSLFRSRGSRASAPAIALGDVWPGSPGQEIIAASPQGKIYLLSLNSGRLRVLNAFRPFADRPRASAARLAVGDFVRQNPGNEIAVGDDGTFGDGIVRIIDPRDGAVLMAFQAFPETEAREGIELWAADAAGTQLGTRLIVGQSSSGGGVRVFDLRDGTPALAATLPNPLRRSGVLRQNLVVVDLLASHPGKEIVVAPRRAGAPLEIHGFEGNTPQLLMTAGGDDEGSVTGLIGIE